MSATGPWIRTSERRPEVGDEVLVARGHDGNSYLMSRGEDGRWSLATGEETRWEPEFWAEINFPKHSEFSA